MSYDPIKVAKETPDVKGDGERWLHFGVSSFLLFIFPTVVFDFIFWNLWQLMSPHLADSWSKGFFYGCCMIILELFMSVCTVGMATVPMIPLLIVSWLILVII